MTPVVLYIGRTESHCGNCNRGADPYEDSHRNLLGYMAGYYNAKGCGAVFTHVQATYVNMDSVVAQMRPDLILIPAA